MTNALPLLRTGMLALVLLATLPAHAGFRIRAVKVNKIQHVLLQDVAAFYGLVYHPSGNTAKLISRYSSLRFDVDKRDATVNGVKISLSYAPAKYQKHFVLSEKDFRLVLEPILRRRSLDQQRVQRILIDPGHGGKDTGASGAKHKEKDVTLKIARSLVWYLRQRGYEAYVTRATDKAMSLDERSALAKRCRADLFVSLHANYVDTKTVHGIETFVMTPKGTPSTYSTKPLNEGGPGNTYDKESMRLAYELQKNILATTGASDRGVKRANFAVLREAPCPAVLVEMGFLSNASEEARLVSPTHQAKLVRGLAAGIANYVRDIRYGNQKPTT